MKIQLIEGWNTFARWWSTWLITTGSAIVAFTPELMEIWRSLPPEVQVAMPESWLRYAGVTIVLLSIPAKLVRQPRVYNDVQEAKY